VKRILLIVGLALMVLIGALAFQRLNVVDDEIAIAEAQPATVMEATNYPSFTLPDVDGVMHELSEWDDRPRLLNFWATWCAPCRREIPLLKALQDEQGSDGVQVIGIAVDFPEQVAAYAETVNFNYPVLVGQEDAMAVAEMSGVEFIGMPFTMILGADGELINAHIGEILREDLDHIVDVLAQLGRGDIDKQTARENLHGL
jgi:thiol-disulfide isomerase/thioredoxin